MEASPPLYALMQKHETDIADSSIDCEGHVACVRDSGAPN